MPGYHTDKKPYASNPHGGEYNYAGKTMLTDLPKVRELTDKEKAENQNIIKNYNQKKTVLTGKQEADRKEKKQVQVNKNKSKPKKSVSKISKVYTVYV
jgi:hypothetical protein